MTADMTEGMTDIEQWQEQVGHLRMALEEREDVIADREQRLLDMERQLTETRATINAQAVALERSTKTVGRLCDVLKRLTDGEDAEKDARDLLLVTDIAAECERTAATATNGTSGNSLAAIAKLEPNSSLSQTMTHDWEPHYAKRGRRSLMNDGRFKRGDKWRWQCYTCDKDYASKQMMEVHFVKHHPQDAMASGHLPMRMESPYKSSQMASRGPALPQLTVLPPSPWPEVTLNEEAPTMVPNPSHS